MARSSKVSVGNRMLERALRQFGDDIIEEVKEIVTETTMIIYNHIVANIPVDDGTLRDSVDFDISVDGLTGQITIGAHYAIYVNYGTGIHAKNGDGRKGGWTYFSEKLNRFVWTEGMEAQPFWEPAIDAGRRHFSKRMKGMG